jgi:hypothetical protein
MVSRQQGYQEPRYQTRHNKETGQFERGAEIGTMRRIGLNPATGLGSYPSPSGVLRGIRRHTGLRESGRVHVAVYGTPGWDVTKHPSPKPDAQGKVWINFFVSRTDLQDALSRHRGLFQLGRIGADPAMGDAVFELSGYNFSSVETVELWPA